MPAVSTIADHVTAILPTVDRGKWDSVGLAQALPKLEVVKQLLPKADRTIMSDVYESELEIGAPSSYEHSYATHPLETATHKLLRYIQTPLVKVRTSMTWSEDEKELQGKTMEKKLDVIQVRMAKWKRDKWEGLEYDVLRFPTSTSQFPDQIRGVKGYWITPNSGVTTFSQYGGLDPVGHTGGKGGIPVATEPLFTNAVGKFAQVTQDDFFDKVDQFLNNVKMLAYVSHPCATPETPSRIGYVIDPIKRAIGRYLSESNENIGNDAGAYRDACFYRSVPFDIWHALSDPQSPVQATVGELMLVDWNSFDLKVHAAFDQKITGPVELPNVPGQNVLSDQTYWALHCRRPDRNLYMTTATTELQPASA